MISQQQTDLVNKLKTFFIERFTALDDPNQVGQHAISLLEHPLFKQYIFSDNIVVIIDHSIGGYRYLSESILQILGYPASEFLQKGFSFSLGLLDHESLLVISSALEKASALTQSLSAEDRPFIRFNYSLMWNTPRGKVCLYQQNIPLVFNEAGLPYLMLALLSDITDFAKSSVPQYKLVLQKPGEPERVLLSNKPEFTITPLTDREREIVFHLSDGLDTNQIADKLFISEGTVRKHRENILEKTKARNSVHLVRLAVANGWM